MSLDHLMGRSCKEPGHRGDAAGLVGHLESGYDWDLVAVLRRVETPHVNRTPFGPFLATRWGLDGKGQQTAPIATTGRYW